jgi:hypothetical protein
MLADVRKKYDPLVINSNGPKIHNYGWPWWELPWIYEKAPKYIHLLGLVKSKN